MATDRIRQALVAEFGHGTNLSHVEFMRIEDVVLDTIRDDYETWDEAHDEACTIALRWDGVTL